MKIDLCDLNADIVAAWERTPFPLDFAPLVVVARVGSIVAQPCDAVVSPANSFGFMDGGVDQVYSDFFGWHVQERIQTAITMMPHRELFVGDALLVSTDHAQIPYLISAPTMRVPKRISDPADVMLAVRAAVSKALAFELKHIAMPGMGTGCGELPPQVAARAMLAGIAAAMKPAEFPKSWQQAQERHFRLQG